MLVYYKKLIVLLNKNKGTESLTNKFKIDICSKLYRLGCLSFFF